ncbi:MAG: hypothetical protein ACR2HG_03930 [Pyrinomonadaceae bacterium]
MPDDKSEAEGIWKQYYGNPDGLSLRLAQICLTKLGVVYQVFALLDDYSDFDVGCWFWKKINGSAILYQLLETNEGIYFCKQLYAMLSAGWYGFPLSQACTTTPGELLLLKTLIDTAKVKPNDTGEPRKLSDAEMDWYGNYNQTNLIFYERDRKTGVMHSYGGTRNKFDLSIRWQLSSRTQRWYIISRNGKNQKT